MFQSIHYEVVPLLCIDLFLIFFCIDRWVASLLDLWPWLAGLDVIIITFSGTLRAISIQPRKLSSKNNCLVPGETWPGTYLPPYALSILCCFPPFQKNDIKWIDFWIEPFPIISKWKKSECRFCAVPLSTRTETTSLSILCLLNWVNRIFNCMAVY